MFLLSLRARQRFLFLCAFLLSLSLLCLSTVTAQEPEVATDEVFGDTTEAVNEAEIAVNLTSPRSTLATFLEAMNAVIAGREAEWTTALSCIYLDEVPESEREAEGRRLARRLFDVLDAITLEMGAVPDESEERNVHVEVGVDTVVPLDFRLNDDENWRFSRTRLTVALDALQESAAEGEPEAPEAAPDLRVDPNLANPRETMRTFIEAMGRWDDGGRERALSTLDLSEISEGVREEIGETAATRLKRVMDRDRIVIYQEIPNTPEGRPYVHLSDRSGPQELRIEIVAQALGDEGEAEDRAYEWRFSAKTIADSGDLYDLYSSRELVVKGVEEVPLTLAIRLRDWVGARYPFLLERGILLENWQWLGLLVIILLGMVASRLFGFVLLRVVRQVFSREQLQLDKKLERGFVRPIRIAVMAWVWFEALKWLGLDANVLALLKPASATISAVAVVWAAYRMVDIFGGYLTEKAARTTNKFDDLIAPLIVKSLKVFVVVIGIVFVAEVNDWNYRTALAGAGIGGLAFALAAKDTLGNIFGSLTILLDKPFQIGDWVTIGSVDGNVESVGMRSTRIRTFYNSVISVPNSTLINTDIDNYGARRYRRFKTMLCLTYDTPPDRIEAFCEGVRELIRRHPYTRKDYFHVYLNEFADSSVNILLYCFHECPDWSIELQERHRLMLDIMRLANHLGVEFAFPTQTLHVQTSENGGDSTLPPAAGSEALALGQRAAAAIVADPKAVGPTSTGALTSEESLGGTHGEDDA